MRERLVPMYLGLAALALLALGANPPAKAAFIETIDQVGSDVVATGSGTLDIKDLTSLPPEILSAGPTIFPSAGDIRTGSPGGHDYNGYTQITGPTSFGPGLGGDPSSGSGDFVGIENSDGPFAGLGLGLIVPQQYVSGAALSDTMTFANQSFASLGLAAGTYVWTWGTGADADSFTLQIGPTTTTAVPEPSSLALFLGALAGVGLIRRRRGSV